MWKKEKTTDEDENIEKHENKRRKLNGPRNESRNGP